MVIAITLVSIIWVWIIYEVWSAPKLDANNRIIGKPKTLKDLFKRK